MKRKLLFIFLVVVVTWFIFYQSLQSAEVSERYSLGLLGILRDALAVFPVFDFLSDHVLRKLAHWSEFCLQALFLCAACFSIFERWWRCLIYILFIGLFTAVLDENLQLLVPGRSGMVQDVLLDFSGTVSGIFVALLLRVVLIFRLIYKMNK